MKDFMECHARMCFVEAGLPGEYEPLLSYLISICEFITRSSMTEAEVRELTAQRWCRHLAIFPTRSPATGDSTQSIPSGVNVLYANKR